MQNLVVHKDNMLKNTQLYGGVIYSQKVLLKLVEKGYTREDAYKIVQKHALNALNGANFKQELIKDVDITSKLSNEELESCFNINDYLKNIDKVFSKFS
jgi:adenylosuccinate lyase